MPGQRFWNDQPRQSSALAQTRRTQGRKVSQPSPRPLVAAGIPQRVLFPLRSTWVVPVQLTYPGCGVIGEVGIMVIVDETAGEVVAWTSPQEMYQATERIYQEHKEEIEIAFNAIQQREGAL